jgi:hypothetical protein
MPGRELSAAPNWYVTAGFFAKSAPLWDKRRSARGSAWYVVGQVPFSRGRPNDLKPSGPAIPAGKLSPVTSAGKPRTVTSAGKPRSPATTRTHAGFQRLMPATLTIGVQVLACSGERYARPPGPVPRYEEAPVMAWDAGAPAEPPAVEAPLGAASVPAKAAAGALRPPAHWVIQRVAERASDERQNRTNVSHD